MLIDVAKAAPMTPHSKGKIKSQSRTTLMTAEIRLHIMANFGAPSKRMMNRETVIHIWNTHEGTNHSR